MKFTPKIGEWFHAFVVRTKHTNGFKVDIKTRCGPYLCTKHVLINTGYVQTVLGEDRDGAAFKFMCFLFRFEGMEKNK